MTRLEVRAPTGSEGDEPCGQCMDIKLPKLIIKGYLTYIVCPPCALEIAQGILSEVRALRIVNTNA